MKRKRLLYVSALWFIPVALVLLEATVFLSKANWQSDYVPYFITFWSLRALLAPLIVWYTLKCWVVPAKWKRLLLVHLGGFVAFSVLFWTIAYILLHDLLQGSDFFAATRTDTPEHIFGMLVDNSVSTNTIVYVSTVSFCYIWEFFRQNITINKKAMELERSLLTSRLELLKGQLNTHFLFNTLHTISSLVVRQQNEEANRMLVRLSELLRFALKENKDQFIPLYREMELLQLYLDIQQTRFKDRLQLNVQVDPAAQDSMIPSMLLQPIVENAVKYGVEPYSDTGIVDIAIHRVNGSLHIAVKDNGRKQFTDIDFSSGIGLGNTKERLGQLYAGTHRFSIAPANDGHGVMVQIEIPHKTNTHVPAESTDS